MKKTILLFLSLILGIGGCSKMSVDSNSNTDIIPKPQNIKVNDGFFSINSNTKIFFDAKFNDHELVSNYLNSFLTKSSGYELEVITENVPKDNYIIFNYDRIN